MNIESILLKNLYKAITDLYHPEEIEWQKLVQIEQTRADIEGDYTVVVFPLLRISGKPPAKTGEEIGAHLLRTMSEIAGYKTVGGFLNLIAKPDYWLTFLNYICKNADFWKTPERSSSSVVMVEFSSPNTNKPLHLGHIRNNLIGNSIAELLKATGHCVFKSTLVNDRGIHICKSMLAWQKWGNGETPESAKKKGDHLVGEYYVRFDKEYKKQVKELTEAGMSVENAEKNAPLIKEARELLRKWEYGDQSALFLWKTMNGWVYEGFTKTYEALNIKFDVTDYESDTFNLGKAIVLKGLEEGIFLRKEDGSVWVDLTKEGLDEKILLRSDGTSVYITQDIGTAQYRFSKFNLDKLIYVVGNEQNYHFQVLTLILKKSGYSWTDNLHHLSYGMVELPSGKMKSREGTVVDADDLISDMIDTAGKIAGELGKLDNIFQHDREMIINSIALGALKYFILKVDPKKNMTFIPEDSIDFNGNTGPFIQYTYARICSVLRKADEMNIQVPGSAETNLEINKKEIELIKRIHIFPSVINEAATELNPALVANYTYELAKEYNQFYHDFSILKEENLIYRDFRLLLSSAVGNIVKSAMNLLGIDMPERM